MSHPTDPIPFKRKISAFASAFESASVTAEITYKDVLSVKPGMTREKAEAFLHIHADLIGAEMLNAGVMVLIARLHGDNKDAS